MTHAQARTRFTQPSPRIFLHFCTYSSFRCCDDFLRVQHIHNPYQSHHTRCPKSCSGSKRMKKSINFRGFARGGVTSFVPCFLAVFGIARLWYANCGGGRRKLAIVCGSEGNFNWWVADQRRRGRARYYSQDGGNFEEFLGETEFENVKMSLIGQISSEGLCWQSADGQRRR